MGSQIIIYYNLLKIIIIIYYYYNNNYNLLKTSYFLQNHHKKLCSKEVTNGSRCITFELWLQRVLWKTIKTIILIFSSVQFSLSVVSGSFWPRELQHARPPCPSPTPRIHPNPCPLSRRCCPTISSSVVPFSSCPSIFPRIRVFSNESALRVTWPTYWSFSFNIKQEEDPWIPRLRHACV